jgi:hypothetical protein
MYCMQFPPHQMFILLPNSVAFHELYSCLCSFLHSVRALFLHYVLLWFVYMHQGQVYINLHFFPC